MMPILWLVACLAQTPTAMGTVTAGALEGRPPREQTSPLQALVDASRPGAVIDVPPGVYQGDLIVDRAVRLVGHGRPRLVGSGAGSVIRIRADDVVIEGFDIDGRLGGDLSRDSAGIHVVARRVVVRDCRIARALFGVYLREAHDTVVERTVVEGIQGRDAGDQGSGIHIWNTHRFRLLGNSVRYSRDGFYLQSSSEGRIAGNTVSDVRYGLHYMFSDDNVFEDNIFERSAAGGALMYSKRLTFRRNQFVHNRGFASVGLLLQACDNVTAEANLIADNARGVFFEGSHENVFRQNRIAHSDVALVIYDSSARNRFEGNAFVANLSPLQLVGRRTDTVFDRNYWSDHDALDFDGDGLADRAYRLSNVFDHLRGNLTAADLFAQSLGASVLSAAERAFPVLEPIPVLDEHPLARPPVLQDVPVAREDPAHVSRWGVAGSIAACAFGAVVLWSGRRPRSTQSSSRTAVEVA
ncbi:MAG: nitrous oxide reductase family maturation protein NosD [Acidobacteriota bacterium]